MPKIVKGPFGLFQHPFSCKKIFLNEGGPFGDISIFWEKSLIVPKKIECGDHLVSSGFVGYV